MGANSLTNYALRKEMAFEINFIDWPVYRGEKTYSEIAQRVIGEYGVEHGDMVGGSSLGGMVALEIARKKKIAAVVLIGSAVGRTEIQGVLSSLLPIATVMPISFIQVLVGKQDAIAAKMFAEADPAFIKGHVPVFAEMARCA